MNIKDIKRIYFVGIGGIGMSALARFFNQRNVLVNGYDKTETELTKALVSENIGVTFQDNSDQVDPNADVVIYTPAIPVDNAILNWYRENNFAVYKRSDAL